MSAALAIRSVAAVIGSRPDEMTGPRIERPLVQARWAVMLALSECEGWSSPRIGKALGGRDHSTVLSGLRRARTLRAADPSFYVLTCVAADAVRSAGL